MSAVSPSSSAGSWTRVAAAAVDAAAGFVLSLLLSSTAGMFFARRAVVTLRIDAPDSFWKGPVPLILGMFGEVVYLLPFALWLASSLDPLTGATIGKRLFGLRVCDAHGGPADPRQRWTRHAVQMVACWGCTVSLLVGRWELGLASLAAGLVVLAGGLADLAIGRRTLHDRAAGTMVCAERPLAPSTTVH